MAVYTGHERHDDAVPVVTADLLTRCAAMHGALDAEIGVHVIERLHAIIDVVQSVSSSLAGDAIVWAIDEALDPAADRIMP